jgi:Ca2+-binding RTX toxin-like protein
MRVASASEKAVPHRCSVLMDLRHLIFDCRSNHACLFFLRRHRDDYFSLADGTCWSDFRGSQMWFDSASRYWGGRSLKRGQSSEVSALSGSAACERLDMVERLEDRSLLTGVGATATVQFTTSMTPVTEASGSVSVTVSLVGTGTLDRDVTVAINSADGTAASPADYSLTTTSVTFMAGTDVSTSPTQSVMFSVVDDQMVEGSEGFSISLGTITFNGADNIMAGSVTSNAVTIGDNDTATVTLSGTAETTEGGSTGSLTATLTLQTTGTGAIQLATDITGITLVSDADFSSDSVSFVSGDSDGAFKTLTVTAINDQLVEGSEMLTGTLANTNSNASVSEAGSGAVNVTDNDTATVTLSGTATTTEGGATGSLTATLTLQTSGMGTIQLATDITGITLASDADFSSDTASFLSGASDGATRTLTVTAANDQFVEGSESLSASLVDSTSNATVTETGSGTVNITDNDSAFLSIAVATTVTEIGGSQTIDVTLTTSDGAGGTATLAAGITLTAEVVVSTTPGTATEGTDYSTFGTQTVTFGPGDGNGATQRVTISVIDDTDNEDAANVDETVNLTLGNLSTTLDGQVSLGTTSAVVTIDDHPFADIVDITPDPLDRANAGIVTINFKEAVTGVDISDFSLTLTTIAAGTVPVSLLGLSVVQVSPLQYTIDLSSVTAAEGVYDLTLIAGVDSNIQDSAGQLLVVDATDNWVLPTTGVVLATNGNVTLTDSGTPTDNRLNFVVETPATGPFAGQAVLVITDPNGIAVGAGANTNQRDNTTIEILLSAMTGSFTVNAGAGDDTLTLDFTNGNPIPAGGLIFNGGAGGNDKLLVIGDATNDSVNYTPGAVQWTGTLDYHDGTSIRLVTFTGLEPVDITDVPSVTVTGSSGRDYFTLRNGFDTTMGGSIPAVVVSGKRSGVTIESAHIWNVDVITIEAGGGNDVVNASTISQSVVLNGGAGNDSLTAGSGNDTLSGGAGRDTLTGGAGTDTLVETSDSDVMKLNNVELTGNGTDKLISLERAVLSGTGRNNVLDASAFTLGNVTLLGGDGNDTLVGGAFTGLADSDGFNDSLDGGAGNDVARQFSRGDQTLAVGPTLGTQVVTGASSVAGDLWNSIEGLQFIGTGDDNDDVKLDASLFNGNVTLEGGGWRRHTLGRDSQQHAPRQRRQRSFDRQRHGGHSQGRSRQ